MNGLQRNVIKKTTIKYKTKRNFLPISFAGFLYTAFKEYRLIPILSRL